MLRKVVLIIGGDVDILNLIVPMLSGMGCVTYTTFFYQPRIRIEQIKPDLVLMDCLSDEFLFRQLGILHYDALMKDVPFIIYSSCSDIAFLAEKYRAAGYLSKPFDKEIFELLVKKILYPDF